MDFERLVCDLLRAKLGIELQSFGHGPDGGVDLESYDAGKRTVVQCKHYRGSSFSDLKKSARVEKAKMDKFKPDSYYFVTSQKLSRTQQQMIVEQLAPHLPDTSSVLTSVDLNQLLEQFPQVELNHFKLWMASAAVIRRIVQSGIWQRSEALMEEIQDRVRLYVVTPSFAKARQMLDEKGVCVVTGAPGVGKSMLADMLALSHWQDGWQIIELHSHEIGAAWETLTPDARQFFYFDDAFGQTDIHERLSNDNGVTVSRLINHIGKKCDKRLVITTRTHVLNEAELRDEPLARSGLRARQCVVEVDEYTKLHRARVLYNHLYFSDLPRATVRDFVNAGMHSKIIDHPNFTPRLVALTLQQLDDQPSAPAIFERMIRTLDHPIELWGASFREALTEPARMILLHLATFPTSGAPHVSLQGAAIRLATPIEYQKAIKQLEGSWINLTQRTPRAGVVVTFSNPSCRDFILSFINSQPEYITDILDNATTIEQISQLLGYASTSSDGVGVKYPALRTTVLQLAPQIANTIRRVGDAEAEKDGSPSVSALASLYEVSNTFKLRVELWIIEQSLRSSERGEALGDISGRSAATLVRAIIEFGRDPKTAVEVSSCKLLALAWVQEVHEATEWEEFFEFSRQLEDVANMSWTSEEGALIDEAFRSWLDAELQAILDNAQDFEEAESWVCEAQKIARDYFGQSDFEGRFTRFETNAAEKFDDPYPSSFEGDHLSRASNVMETPLFKDTPLARLFDEVIAAKSARDRETDEIRALFEHLK